MKLRQYLQEDKGTEQMVQKAFDKAHTDINKGTDTPVKKSSPINQIQTKMGLEEEEKEVSSLIIKIEFGNDSMQSSVDAETAIKDAFKRYRLGSGGAKFVKIYDENGNSVGSLEVK